MIKTIQFLLCTGLVMQFNQTIAQDQDSTTVPMISEEDTSVSKSYKGTTSASLQITSNYIWRDYIFDYWAIQPNTDYSFGESGFSVNFWSSFGVNYQTVDLQISSSVFYGDTIGKRIQYSIGLLHYLAPVNVNLVDSTVSSYKTNFSEVTISFSRPDSLLSPRVISYVTNTGEVYSNFSINRDFLISKKRTISLLSSIGYRFGDLYENNGFRDFNFEISSPINLRYTSLLLYARFTHIIRPNLSRFQVGTVIAFN